MAAGKFVQLALGRAAGIGRLALLFTTTSACSYRFTLGSTLDSQAARRARTRTDKA